MTRLAGSRVLVTGAASGIGRLLALEADARGARVILWDRDEKALAALQKTLSDRNSWCSTCRVDLGDYGSIASGFEQVIAECGGVDILINNAGVVSGKTVTELTDREIRETLDVNLLAPMRVTRLFLPSMLAADRGHIVNISSAAGIIGGARLSDYAAAKFGLFGFDESLRTELRRLGSQVKTTIVCPYYVNTGMFAGVRSRVRWLLPILDPEKVSWRILRAVERDARRLVMPWFVYSGWPLRLLPVSALDWLIDAFGISTSMDSFVGRNRSPR